MYVVPLGRAWTDDSNHTKYSKSPKINYPVFEIRRDDKFKLENMKEKTEW